jgi:hypothetical protein
MVRVRHCGRQICRRCHKFPGQPINHARQDTARKAEGNAVDRAAARPWQPRRRRNRPLDRWLCVPAFRRVCPCHSHPVSKPRRVESRPANVVRLSTGARHGRSEPPWSRLCRAPRVICNETTSLPRPGRQLCPAAAAVRERKCPRSCSAAAHGGPSAGCPAWPPPRCRGERPDESCGYRPGAD